VVEVPPGLVVVVEVELPTVLEVVLEGTIDVVVVVRGTVVLVLVLVLALEAAVVVVGLAGRRVVVVVGALVVLVVGTTTPGTYTGCGTGGGRTRMYVASAARKIASEIQVESRTCFTRRRPGRWSPRSGRRRRSRLGARPS
jgi:hypothetical protein